MFSADIECVCVTQSVLEIVSTTVKSRCSCQYGESSDGDTISSGCQLVLSHCLTVSILLSPLTWTRQVQLDVKESLRQQSYIKDSWLPFTIGALMR